MNPTSCTFLVSGSHVHHKPQAGVTGIGKMREVIAGLYYGSYNNIGIELENSWKKSHYYFNYKIRYVSIVCLYEIVMWFGFCDIRPGECRQKDPRKLLEVVSDTFKWYFHRIPPLDTYCKRCIWGWLRVPSLGYHHLPYDTFDSCFLIKIQMDVSQIKVSRQKSTIPKWISSMVLFFFRVKKSKLFGRHWNNVPSMFPPTVNQ